MRPFLIPDDFRAFMQHVVRVLDAPRAAGTRPPFIDAEDALADATGYGGRVDGADTFRFTYISSDGQQKWQAELREAQIRDIADGLLIEVPAERQELTRTVLRDPKGHPLLLWGDGAEDALVVRDRAELARALDALHTLARARPRMLRAWSATDDQLVAVLRGDHCALYVIESLDGYATSCAAEVRPGSFELPDLHGRAFTAQLADCVPWGVARAALVSFIERGELAPEVRFEGRIPTGLLMLGEVDRAQLLAVHAGAARTFSTSSLPRLVGGGAAAAPPAPAVEPTADAPSDAVTGVHGEPTERTERTLDEALDELPTPPRGARPRR
jgi:hypothetical protein